MSTTVSIPGKLMLVGEHAVIYGKPCIVTAVSPRLQVTGQTSNWPELCLQAKDIGVGKYIKQIDQLGKGDVPRQVRYVEQAVFNFWRAYPQKGGVKLRTAAASWQNYGLGSSSAVTVGTIKALAELFRIKLTKKQLFDLAYQTVRDVQGKGSGFDIAAAVYGGILYFAKAGKVIEPLANDSLPLVVGYSGMKADTVSLIEKVAKMRRRYQSIVDSIFNQIEIIVNKAKRAIVKKDWQQLGKLMDLNQGYLEALGVGSKKLAALIYAARDAGAYGAKISGAGGGDCMIAVVSKEKINSVEKAIKAAGGKVLNVQMAVDGVKIVD